MVKLFDMLMRYVSYFCGLRPKRLSSLFPLLLFLSLSLLQLRVVRAFKSTLEDIEEKRSIHSFQSSIRSSRSHQGHRPLSEELHSPMDFTGKVPPGEQNGSYTNMALVIHEHPAESYIHRNSKVSTKSRSAENLSLSRNSLSVSAESTGVNGYHQRPQPPSPRTFSASDIQTRLCETSI